jgi:hypothetical protein
MNDPGKVVQPAAVLAVIGVVLVGLVVGFSIRSSGKHRKNMEYSTELGLLELYKTILPSTISNGSTIKAEALKDKALEEIGKSTGCLPSFIMRKDVAVAEKDAPVGSADLLYAVTISRDVVSLWTQLESSAG